MLLQSYQLFKDKVFKKATFADPYKDPEKIWHILSDVNNAVKTQYLLTVNVMLWCPEF